jgi:hypothetical protein
MSSSTINPHNKLKRIKKSYLSKKNKHLSREILNKSPMKKKSYKRKNNNVLSLNGSLLFINFISKLLKLLKYNKSKFNKKNSKSSCPILSKIYSKFHQKLI